MLIDKGCISWEYINIYSIHNTKIGIPIFQRFYDWNSKQMNETLNDILNSLKNPNKEIYLLDFIYYVLAGDRSLRMGGEIPLIQPLADNTHSQQDQTHSH